MPPIVTRRVGHPAVRGEINSENFKPKGFLEPRRTSIFRPCSYSGRHRPAMFATGLFTIVNFTFAEPECKGLVVWKQAMPAGHANPN